MRSMVQAVRWHLRLLVLLLAVAAAHPALSHDGGGANEKASGSASGASEHCTAGGAGAGNSVHVVYVSRGPKRGMLSTALLSAENIFKAADAGCQARLCFHVIGGQGALADHKELKAKYTISSAVTVHNVTDAELVKKLEDDGRKMFYHKRVPGPGMPRLCTAAKLFLFQVMPEFVHRALVIDSDTVVLHPVCQLTDHFGEQIQQPGRENVVISYAHEQQNTYQQSSKNYSTTVNGGVAVHELVRMRTQGHYRKILQELMAIGLPMAQSDFLADQSIYVEIAQRYPSQWAQLHEELPCEWNWQLCLFWYAKSKKGVGSDVSCPRPPKILHTLCTAKDVGYRLVGRILEPNGCDCRDMLAMLQEHIRDKQTGMGKDCARVGHTYPALRGRHCEPKFLLHNCAASTVCGPTARHILVPRTTSDNGKPLRPKGWAPPPEPSAEASVAIIMMDTRGLVTEAPGPADYWKVAAALNQAYARYYGYDFLWYQLGVNRTVDLGSHLEDQNRFKALISKEKTATSCYLHKTVKRGAPWCKMIAIAAALERGYKTVVFVDSDAYFNVDDALRLSIPQIVGKYGHASLGDHPVWCPTDGPWKKGSPNSAMQIWSNSDAARALLRTWWQTDVSPTVHAYEQTAIYLRKPPFHVVGVLEGFHWQLKYTWHTWPAAHIGSLFKVSRMPAMSHAFSKGSAEFVARSRLGQDGSFGHKELHECIMGKPCASLNLPGAKIIPFSGDDPTLMRLLEDD